MNESWIWRRKSLYDHSEGVIHIENIIAFVSTIFTIIGMEICLVEHGDALLFMFLGTLTGLAGFIASVVIMAEAGYFRKIKRILTAFLGFIESLAMVAINVLMYLFFVLNYVP